MISRPDQPSLYRGARDAQDGEGEREDAVGTVGAGRTRKGIGVTSATAATTTLTGAHKEGERQGGETGRTVRGQNNAGGAVAASPGTAAVGAGRGKDAVRTTGDQTGRGDVVRTAHMEAVEVGEKVVEAGAGLRRGGGARMQGMRSPKWEL